MKPIKTIAGELLLYFYAKQRKIGFHSMDILHFTDWKNIKLVGQGDIAAELSKIDPDPANLYNALSYLKEKYYLDFRDSQSTGDDSLHGFRVTATGIDIVEGVERDSEAKNNFTVNFNIKLADNVTIESLIKNELGGLFKASLL